jgi:hypothetical protein
MRTDIFKVEGGYCVTGSKGMKLVMLYFRHYTDAAQAERTLLLGGMND